MTPKKNSSTRDIALLRSTKVNKQLEFMVRKWFIMLWILNTHKLLLVCFVGADINFIYYKKLSVSQHLLSNEFTKSLLAPTQARLVKVKANACYWWCLLNIQVSLCLPSMVHSGIGIKTLFPPRAGWLAKQDTAALLIWLSVYKSAAISRVHFLYDIQIFFPCQSLRGSSLDDIKVSRMGWPSPNIVVNMFLLKIYLWHCLWIKFSDIDTSKIYW